MLTMVPQGTRPVWVRDGWDAMLGSPMLFDFPSGPDSAVTWDPAQLREYGEAVFAQTDAYLAGLTPTGLAREVDLCAAGMGTMLPATFLLTLLPGNTCAQTEEISALKGRGVRRGVRFCRGLHRV